MKGMRIIESRPESPRCSRKDRTKAGEAARNVFAAVANQKEIQKGGKCAMNIGKKTRGCRFAKQVGQY